MGKLDITKVSLSLGTTGAILSIVCGLAYLIAPSLTIGFFTNLLHSSIQIQQIPWTLEAFVISTVLSFISGAIVGLVFVPIYNYFEKE